MLLTIDVGNSDIVCIIYDNNKKIITKERITILNSDLDYFFKILKAKYQDDDLACIVSCVNFEIKNQLEKIFKKLFHNVYFIDYLSYPNISNSLKYPNEIGSDLVSSSVEIIENYQQPAIIVDMGSATKLILVNNNTIIGVSIVLGLKNTSKAMNSQIKHLPEIALNWPSNILGNDTISALESGLMYANLYMIEGFIQAIEADMDVTLNKYLCGGIANLFHKKLNDFIFIEDLVNAGLYTIYHTKGVK